MPYAYRTTRQIRTARDLHAYLEWHGWSTTAPADGDTWVATAWPPLRLDDQPTADAKRVHAELYRIGMLGQMEYDAEGALCARVLTDRLGAK